CMRRRCTALSRRSPLSDHGLTYRMGAATQLPPADELGVRMGANAFTPLVALHTRDSQIGIYGMYAAHSALTPANLITLAHFSVSSAMSLPNSAGDPGGITVLPTSAIRAVILGSARPTLISVLS